MRHFIRPIKTAEISPFLVMVMVVDELVLDERSSLEQCQSHSRVRLVDGLDVPKHDSHAAQEAFPCFPISNYSQESRQFGIVSRGALEDDLFEMPHVLH